MPVNIDSLLEVITRASNELGRAKDALLKEKERAETPVEERLTAAQWAAQMDRDSYARTERDYLARQAAAETKPTTKAGSKNS